MKVLVTGGAGFIGSHLVEELVKRKHKVRVLDDLSAGRMENLEAVEKKIEFVKGSISDKPTVDGAMKGCKGAYHLAAMVSVQDSIKNPVKTWDVNIRGTLLVLGAAKREKAKRVVLSSSAAVYGDAFGLPKMEDGSLQPKSPYGESKHINEMNAVKYWKDYGLETVCLRYFNVYGPRQVPDSPYSGVITKFVRAGLKGERPVIYGDGKQTRDFVYVKDVVGANVLAMGAAKAPGEIFNIGTGRETSILRLWNGVAGLTKSSKKPKYEDERQGDIYRSYASIEKAKKLLKYAPEWELKKGLGETVEWMKNA